MQESAAAAEPGMDVLIPDSKFQTIAIPKSFFPSSVLSSTLRDYSRVDFAAESWCGKQVFGRPLSYGMPGRAVKFVFL